MDDRPGIARTANLLGALALVVADRMADAVTAAAGHSATAAAALSSLDAFLGTPSVDRLRQVLGLTSSGTVRLVDRLERDGYVRRGRGPDGRVTTVTLTEAGRRAAGRVARARAEVLEGALAALPEPDRAALAEITGRLLVGLMRGPGATRWMCRLCDLQACGRPYGSCPVAEAARERYG